MTIIAVSTAQELMEALESANGGDRIELAAGDYGDLHLLKMAFDEEVTISSADPDALASFNTIYFNFIENLTLENVFVDFQPTVDTLDFYSALQVGNSSHITIDNVVLEGELMAYDPDAGNFDMVAIARAASIFKSNDVTFSNNDVSVFRSGLNLLEVQDITISDNKIHEVRSSGTGGADIQDLVLTGNHFYDFTPYGNPSTDGDHSGFVHYWSRPEQDTLNTNFYIADNFFELGGNGIQEVGVAGTNGINLEDLAGNLGFQNVVIENNVLHHADLMSIAVDNGRDIAIRDNTLLQSGGEFRKAPGIMIVGDVVENWTIENNILTEIDGVAIRATHLDYDDLDINVSNNLLVQRFNPEADNYVGKLFVNALTPNGSIDGFQAIPGTAAALVGAGQLHSGDETSLIVIATKVRDGLETLSISVSVKDLLGGVSDADIEKMSITWDFGDGTTATGNDLVHTYAQTGSYNISGIAQAQDGTRILLTKTVEVKTPNGIDIRFDTGIVDISDTQNDATVTGNAQLVNVSGGKALDLKDANARVKFDLTDELRNNPNFTLSFDFKYDDDSQSGFAIYFPSTAIIRLDNGELQLIAKTNLDESVNFQTKDLNLDDSDWHRASYVLSQATGTASLYIDGALIGTISGLEGIQPEAQSHGLTLGSPFGQSFAGQLDNVSFLRAALTEDDIDVLHSGTDVDLSELVGVSAPEAVAPIEEDIAPVVTQTPSSALHDVSASEVVAPEVVAPVVANTSTQDPVVNVVSVDVENVEQTDAPTPAVQVTLPSRTNPTTVEVLEVIEPAVIPAPVIATIDTAPVESPTSLWTSHATLQEILLQSSEITTGESSGGWNPIEVANAEEATVPDTIGSQLFGEQSLVRFQDRAVLEDRDLMMESVMVHSDTFDFA